MRETISLKVLGFFKNLLINPLFWMNVKQFFLLIKQFCDSAIHSCLFIFIFFLDPHATSSETLLHIIDLRYLEKPIYSSHQITHCRGRSYGSNWVTSNLTARIAERSKKRLNFFRCELWRSTEVWSKESYKLENKICCIRTWEGLWSLLSEYICSNCNLIEKIHNLSDLVFWLWKLHLL